MSRLFLNDDGRILKDHNEDLTRWRRARKTFVLPASAAGAGADLWFIAAPYDGGGGVPLRVRLNGRALGRITGSPPNLSWHRLRVGKGRLRAGANQFDFECDTPAMNAWKLGIAGRAGRSGSAISFDGGESWQNDCMGLYGALTGEYVVRLRSRSAALHDPAPGKVVYPDPKHPKLAELRRMIPRSVTRSSDPWRRLLALRTWVATRWSHDPFGPPYCPWDAPTILDWARRDRGHSGRGKVAMCVHFGVVFASLATALGFRARCIAVTRAIGSNDGHFLCEVLDQEQGRWILHDANFDLHYEDDRPLSAVDVAQRIGDGASMKDCVRAGRGLPTKPARVVEAYRRLIRSGDCCRLISVWRRMDFMTDPSVAPGHHGSVAYLEPQWVWFDPSREETAMFPLRTGEKWFARS